MEKGEGKNDSIAGTKEYEEATFKIKKFNSRPMSRDGQQFIQPPSYQWTFVNNGRRVGYKTF